MLEYCPDYHLAQISLRNGPEEHVALTIDCMVVILIGVCLNFSYFILLISYAGKYYGYCVDLIEELKNMMNFQYELYETKDGFYGQMNEQMEWDGMIRDVSLF